MNLKAMVIIIAISCAGSPSLLKGDNRDSIPSANAIGLVVKVKRLAKRIRNRSRRAI
jgi:hypothetical protein